VRSEIFSQIYLSKPDLRKSLYAANGMWQLAEKRKAWQHGNENAAIKQRNESMAKIGVSQRRKT